MQGIGLDGITTYVHYISNSDNSSNFSFWSPNREVYKVEYKLLDSGQYACFRIN